MATAIMSSKFQIVLPKQVREKLRLKPRQRLQAIEKGGIIMLERRRECLRRMSERRRSGCESPVGCRGEDRRFTDEQVAESCTLNCR